MHCLILTRWVPNLMGFRHLLLAVSHGVDILGVYSMGILLSIQCVSSIGETIESVCVCEWVSESATQNETPSISRERFNPRAGNGILHPYTGNGGGGKLPPRAFKVMMLANGWRYRSAVKMHSVGYIFLWNAYFVFFTWPLWNSRWPPIWPKYDE